MQQQKKEINVSIKGWKKLIKSETKKENIVKMKEEEKKLEQKLKDIDKMLNDLELDYVHSKIRIKEEAL